jgi:asparagine synthase (glutamine-hydrolysing)
MCGIAGIVMHDGTAPSVEVLDRFARALGHRGPDGEGKHLAGPVGMVMTRLAIIDLMTGDQPIYDPGGVALIANAEIYNYIELRKQLNGATFTTKSDCEPPLHLYRRNGLSFTDDLRGMYAIAIHDPAQGRLVLARDPFGIKPLYYVEKPDLFAFASEPRALIAAGLVDASEDPEHRDELLQLQFTCGRNTIYKNISRVLPGETLEVRGGRIVSRRLRPALPPPSTAEINQVTALKHFSDALVDAIEKHQRSDVPYGLFLSGGTDSATMLTLMARHAERPVQTFTAGFSEKGVHDERSHARQLAKSVGAEHHEVEFTETDFWSLLPQIAGCMDDPAADYAILPTWKLAREAAQDLKVVLSGEGGDELFAGYGRYRSVLRPFWQGGRAIRPRGSFDRLRVLRHESNAWRDGIASAEATATMPGRTKLQIAQATDVADWLPNNLLTKLDRCLMSHGLEGRTPLLDPVVADAVFSLPDRFKIQNGQGKWLLRQWLAENFPASHPFEKKRGFTVPVGEWMGRHGDRLGELVARDPAVEAVCHPSRIKALYTSTKKRARFAAWTLLFYALWHRRNIRNLPADGDTFECLASP